MMNKITTGARGKKLIMINYSSIKQEQLLNWPPNALATRTQKCIQLINFEKSLELTKIQGPITMFLNANFLENSYSLAN